MAQQSSIYVPTEQVRVGEGGYAMRARVNAPYVHQAQGGRYAGEMPGLRQA